MIVKMPAHQSWRQHLHTRLQEAKLLGIADVDEISMATARMFVPETRGVSYDEMTPESSLRENFSVDKVEADKWVRRADLLYDAAVWLHEEYLPDEKRVLLCEAGYSKAGDASLNRTPHVIMGGNPFFRVDLSASEADKISEVLRLARSRRLLGFVFSETNTSKDRGNGSMLFICDAFDGDSLIVVEVKGRIDGVV